MKTCPICEKSWPSNHSSCPTDGALLIDLRELEPGTVIRGKYRIERKLGRGGMGTVYLAEHIMLGRPRALKFISSELSQDAAFLRRFRREAQAASELRHPNVVEVVDLDQAEDGSPYIAMEYVEGPDLRHALAAGPFSVERALYIARGIALGLGAAHAKGIIHRDVKPENILLASGHGAPETSKLLDFGIAAMKESITAASRTHGLLLTPHYAAPEQWKGMGSADLDGRADVYALGGVLYEMLTRHTPFHAANTEGWMYQHIHEQPRPPSQLRLELANWQGLDDLVLHLLAKDREQRPKDIAELLGILDAMHFVAHVVQRETVREEVQPDVSPKREEAQSNDSPEYENGESYVGSEYDEVESSQAPLRWLWVCISAVGLGLMAFAVWYTPPWTKDTTNMAVQAPTVQPRTEKTQQKRITDSTHTEKTLPERITESAHSGKTQSERITDSKGTIPLFAVNGELQDCTPDKLDAALKAGGKLAIRVLNPEGMQRWVPITQVQSVLGIGYKFVDDVEARRYEALKSRMNIPDNQVVAHDGQSTASQDSQPAQVVTPNQPTKEPSVAETEQKAIALYNQRHYSEAKPLFDRACSGGNADACDYIGRMYAEGHGVTHNGYLAVSLYSKACDAGSGQGCSDLGDLYYQGNGVPKDKKKAGEYFGKGCSMGNNFACAKLKQLH